MQKLQWVIGGFVVLGLMTGSFFVGRQSAKPKTIDVIVLTDKRCKECAMAAEQMPQRLKSSIMAPLNFKTIDYTDANGKRLFEQAKLKTLPAILFPKNAKSNEAMAQIARYLEDAGEYANLQIGSRWDPKSEICDNREDDNNDGKIDCDDPTCSSSWLCMKKMDKPEMELFVMSHCPFGTQVEKGVLPVVKLLKNKANISVKFCNYAMHGEKEVKEQMNQYCIQTAQNDKYWSYLECFLGSSGSEDDAKKCIDKAKVNKQLLAQCVSATDSKFLVSASAKDKSKWKGQFPPFPVFDELNSKYGVQGSPTVIINGVVAEVGRSASQLLEGICKGFANRPKECDQKLDSNQPSPGFGFAKGGAPASGNAQCGN